MCLCAARKPGCPGGSGVEDGDDVEDVVMDEEDVDLEMGDVEDDEDVEGQSTRENAGQTAIPAESSSETRVFHVVFPLAACVDGNDSRNSVGAGIIAGRDFDGGIFGVCQKAKKMAG